MAAAAVVAVEDSVEAMIVHHVAEEMTVDPEVEAAMAVVNLVKAIGFAQVARTRTLHGETNATDARSQREMTQVQEVVDHHKEEDSKVETGHQVAAAVDMVVVRQEFFHF